MARQKQCDTVSLELSLNLIFHSEVNSRSSASSSAILEQRSDASSVSKKHASLHSGRNVSESSVVERGRENSSFPVEENSDSSSVRNRGFLRSSLHGATSGVSAKAKYRLRAVFCCTDAGCVLY